MQNSQFDYSNLATFLEVVLRECGDIITTWHQRQSPSNKYLNEYVTTEVNNHILSKLKNELPGHELFTKGSADTGTKEYEWICDPLDGAFIYSKGMTSVVISMTLVHGGEPVLAGIYQPFLKDLYLATVRKGITKNGQKLPRISRGLTKYEAINAEWWPAASYNVDQVVRKLSIEHDLYPLHIGSVVYSACLVAEGTLVASLFGGHLVGKNHEAAAVMLLMQEAGGKYTDLRGHNIGFEGVIPGFIISTPEAFSDILSNVEDEMKKC